MIEVHWVSLILIGVGAFFFGAGLAERRARKELNEIEDRVDKAIADVAELNRTNELLDQGIRDLGERFDRLLR